MALPGTMQRIRLMNLRDMGSFTPISIAFAALAAVSAGCSSAGSDEVSFVGPEIDGVRDIRIVNLSDESSRQVLPRAIGLGTAFEWFPDGKRAAVYRGDAFYVTEVEQDLIGECLTCDFDDFGGFAFSPDGGSIAWPARDGIYLQDIDDYSLEKVVELDRPAWLSWSPDSKSISFTLRDVRLGIYRLDLEDGSVTPLTDDESVSHLAPAYSPARDQIAFHALDKDGLRLTVMDADGSQMRVVTEWTFGGEIFDPGLQDPPQWSPDGKQLLYTAASARGDTDIFVVELDTGEVTNLTNLPGADKSAVWSADGRLIAFASHRSGDWEIYVMNADGGNVRNVSERPVTPEMNPQWRP